MMPWDVTTPAAPQNNTHGPSSCGASGLLVVMATLYTKRTPHSESCPIQLPCLEFPSIGEAGL